MNDSALYCIQWAEEIMDSIQVHDKDRIQLNGSAHVSQMRAVLSERMGKTFERLKFVRYCDSITEDLKAKHNLQLCVLIRLGFSVSQIAVFMAVSPTSVSQQKTRMKKRLLQQKPDLFSDGETLDLWLRRF